MESPLRTSFIPQQGPKTPTPTRKRPGTVGLLTIVGVVVFVGSLVASGGVFFYKQYLENTLQEKIQSLENAKGAFDPELLTELSSLDARINEAKKIIEGHRSMSLLFDFLEKSTLQSVRLKSFNYGSGSEVGTFNMSLVGEAKSFATVALQSDEYAKNEMFDRAIFSGINATETGNVSFNIDTTIKSGALSFSKTIGPVADSVSTIRDITTDITSANVDGSIDEALVTEEVQSAVGETNETTP